MQMSDPKTQCVTCLHEIDASAKLCPFCGANPVTGEKFDPTPVLEKHFPRKEPLTPAEGALQFVRDRQAIFVTGVVIALVLVLFGIHKLMLARNAQAVTDVPAVPLTEVADLASLPENEADEPMPEIDFQYDGDPKRMRMLLMEPGAVAPPPEPVTPANVVQGTPGAAAARPGTGATPASPATNTQRTTSATVARPGTTSPASQPANVPRPPARTTPPANTPRPPETATQ
ncbi:MAG: hypothetical protein ACYC9N_01210 [Thermoanaerobaculia bacterium]